MHEWLIKAYFWQAPRPVGVFQGCACKGNDATILSYSDTFRSSYVTQNVVTPTIAQWS
jgi:hypothetical protein